MTEPIVKNERFNPFTSLVLITGLVLVSSGLFSFVAAYLAVYIFDAGSIETFTASFENQLKHPEALIFVQGISALGTFVLPAIVFAHLSGSNPVKYFTLNKPVSWLLALLSVFILLSGQAVVNISAHVNQQLSFPGWLEGVGTWMSDMNTKVDEGYKLFLDIKTVPRLLVMLVVAAIIPAFGEEFLFRGILQNIFHQWTKNGHLAVWIAAFIFSIIHLQVLNFLPRLLLGAMLGYLYLWSGNLWLSIIAHLFNNAILLIYAYYYLKTGGTLEELQSTGDIQWVPSILATMVFAGLLYVFNWKAHKRPIYAEGT